MPDVVYRSEGRIERVKGTARRAYLPAEAEPVIFGVHGAVAEHYGVPPQIFQLHATALDYIIAVAAVSEAVGEIELADGVLMIRRIHARLKLRVQETDWETAGRAHSLFTEECPVNRSLKPAIAMTTELILEPET